MGISLANKYFFKDLSVILIKELKMTTHAENAKFAGFAGHVRRTCPANFEKCPAKGIDLLRYHIIDFFT